MGCKGLLGGWREGEGKGILEVRLPLGLGTELTVHGDGEDAHSAQRSLPLEGVSVLITVVH